MTPNAWRESLKASAIDALRKLSDDVLDDARKVINKVEKAGHAIKLNATGDGLIVSPAPVPADLAALIRQHRAEVLELVKDAARVWVWEPKEFVITVSLAKSAVTDFFLAPVVDGVPHAAIKPEISAVFTDAE